MSDTPPPMQSSTDPTPQPKLGGGGKVAMGCGLGCLAAVIVCVVLVFVGIGIAKNKIAAGVDNFTASEPVLIEAPDVSQPEIDDTVARFDGFRDSLKNGETPAPLILSEDDINALLFHHPLFKDVAGKTRVTVENDRLKGNVSIDLDQLAIPIPMIADAVKGQYFNGDATVSIDMAAGRPVMFIEALTVNGATIPEVVMTGIREENLLKNSESDPRMKGFFDGIQDFTIENDQLKIVPKGS